MMNRKLVCMGELLIDFSQAGEGLYKANPGGGPANAACMAAKLGTDVSFIGQVGDDAFGRMLKDKLDREGVGTEGLNLTYEAPTTLAFVHLSPGGERSFSFYRHQSADTLLRPSESTRQMVRSADMFFCSTVMMAEGPSRESSFAFLNEARLSKVPVAFDPNVRINLYPAETEVKTMCRESIVYTDIFKASEEEIAFITGITDMDEAARYLQQEYPNLKIILVTLGERGTRVYFQKKAQTIPSFRVKTVDTTGAGDAFMGAFMAGVLSRTRHVETLSWEEICEIVRWSNAAGAITTTAPGAIDSQPSRQDLIKLLAADQNHK